MNYGNHKYAMSVELLNGRKIQMAYRSPRELVRALRDMRNQLLRVCKLYTR
jgi:hypothetical protein